MSYFRLDLKDRLEDMLIEAALGEKCRAERLACIEATYGGRPGSPSRGCTVSVKLYGFAWVFGFSFDDELCGSDYLEPPPAEEQRISSSYACYLVVYRAEEDSFAELHEELESASLHYLNYADRIVEEVKRDIEDIANLRTFNPDYGDILKLQGGVRAHEAVMYLVDAEHSGLPLASVTINPPCRKVILIYERNTEAFSAIAYSGLCERPRALVSSPNTLPAANAFLEQLHIGIVNHKAYVIRGLPPRCVENRETYGDSQD